MSFDEFVDRLRLMERVREQLKGRAVEASHVLRGAALQVLRGKRSGRRYRIPATRRYYVASAPGEPPAVRTGAFRLSWHVAPEGQIPGIRTFRGRLARWLDEGTKDKKPVGGMDPRPFVEPIKAKAWPAIKRIYRRPYLS